MALPAFPGVAVPPELLPHAVSVEREGAAGSDQSGAPTPAWSAAYASLPCLIDAGGPAEFAEYAELEALSDATAYFGALPDGTLPQIDVRCRLTLLAGTGYPAAYPDGTPRRFSVVGAKDEALAGLVLTVRCRELRPGGM